MSNNIANIFNFSDSPKPEGVFLARHEHVKHLIKSGSLVYTYLDLETTDKDWKTAEITLASLTVVDIGFNLISDDLYEVCVPDRVGLSPEAMLITRYMASKLRQKDRLPPQIAAAKLYEAVQDAPRRLWRNLENWKEKMGEEAWQNHVDEKYILIPTKSGGEREVLIRHFPTLDESNRVLKNVRVHEPQSNKEFMDMSYLVGPKEAFDYEDEVGRWKIRQLDKHNLGFRNTFFDNRMMAAVLFRANFPQKLIYAMNRKALGNHAADVFTMALSDHFFGQGGETRIKLGTRIDSETSREKISAKLDLLLEENTRVADNDTGTPEGVRVADGTLHNLKRGHNAPDYDNAKSIGIHRYMREFNPHIVAHIERCGHVDYFRRFMTHDIEDGIPTTHPIRFGIISANDDQIYRAVPLIVLGSDDQHGKFNKIWAVRADVDFAGETFNGKNILDLSAEELAEMIRIQKGQPDAVFHEIHLKRHRGVFDLETGLKAGHAPGLSKETLRYRRDALIDYLDDHDRPFLHKALDAFSMQYAFSAPADDIPQPFVEEEIWTAMGDIKYAFVTAEDGRRIKLPNIIREMAQDEFKRLNDRIGDTIRELLRPQPLEWAPTARNALAYAKRRAKQEKKLEDYQSTMPAKQRIYLPLAEYPFSSKEILSKNPPILDITDAVSTLLKDRLYLMDKLYETTRSYEVQQFIFSDVSRKYYWQTIPFEALAHMEESRILNLRDEGRLRIKFEENPNRPAFRFAIRNFVESDLGDLLSPALREFYNAETSAYVHGPIYIPDPEEHRVMSAERIRASIDRIRQNIKPGDDYVSASREGERGAFELYANDNFAESIIDNVERDTKRRCKDYPFSDKRQYLFGINPLTHKPLLNVKYEIPKSHITVVVPDGVPLQPASHPQFGHSCIVIPTMEGIKDGVAIVLEEEKTKRKFFAAAPVLHHLPERKLGAYEHFYRRIDAAYQAGGHDTPQLGLVLSCQELAPVTRPRDRDFPSVRIPMDRLMATRSPVFGNLQRDDVLQSFIVRKYDLRFKKDQKIILRGTDKDLAETGWEAIAEIAQKSEEMTLKELLAMVDDPSRRQEAGMLAHECGYANADDLKAAMLAEFTKFDENILNDQNELIFFKVKPVKAIHYWTPHQPRAAFENNLLQPNSRDPKPKKAKLAAKHPILEL